MPTYLRCQEYNIGFRYIGTESGLSAREIYAGLKDKRGFIWLASRNGLNRFDGTSVVSFTESNKQLRRKGVAQLANLSNDEILLQYANPSFVYSPAHEFDILNTKTFERLAFDVKFPHAPFKEKEISWVQNDDQNNTLIVLNTPFRVFVYKGKETFLPIYEDKKDRKEHYYRNEILTNNNLIYLRTSSNEILCFENYKLKSHISIQYPHLNFLCINNDKELEYSFISPENAKRIYSKYNPFTKITSESGLLSHAISNYLGPKLLTTCMMENDTTGIYFIRDQGVFLGNKNSLIQLINNKDIINNESMNIYSSFSDKIGNIWICTSGGIYVVNISKNNFKHAFVNRNNAPIENQARGIYVNKGKIIANVWQSVKIASKNSEITIPTPIINFPVFTIQNEIYGASNFIYKVNQENKSIQIFEGTSRTEIMSVLPLNDNSLLIGRTDGLEIYDFPTSKLVKLSVPASVQMHLPYRIKRRVDNSIWVCGENNLLLLDKNANFINQWNTGKSSNPVFPVDNFTDFYEDNNGNMWLTTNGDGLIFWNRKTNLLKIFNQNNGLPSPTLYRIEADNDGFLWISSEYGLIRFNTSTYQVQKYFVSNGLSNNEFNRMSSYKDENGWLYFGSINGINYFDPSTFNSASTQVQIPLQIVNYVQFNGKNEKLEDRTTTLALTNEIVLQPGDKFFTIEYKLLDYSNSKHLYSYIIEGFDNTWINTYENRISISNLPYGNYTLRIKAQNTNGVWSDKVLSIPIHVVKPFYRTTAFLLILLIFSILMIYLLFKWRTHQLQKSNTKLAEIVKNKTEDLANSLKEKEDLLSELHHRVKNNIQVVVGLLDMQRRQETDLKVKNALAAGQNRLNSMLLIHQHLYKLLAALI